MFPHQRRRTDSEDDAEGKNIVAALRDKNEQDIEAVLSGADTGRLFVAFDVPFGTGGSVWTALLEQDGIWYAREFTPEQVQAGVRREDWTIPFSANWKGNFMREDRNNESIAFSLHLRGRGGTSDKRGVDRKGGKLIAIVSDAVREMTECGQETPTSGKNHATKYVGLQGVGVIYPLIRSSDTPLAQLCVADLLRLALGTGPCESILDLDARQPTSKGIFTCFYGGMFRRLLSSEPPYRVEEYMREAYNIKDQRYFFRRVNRNVMTFVKNVQGLINVLTSVLVLSVSASLGRAADWWKPYAPPCVERENVFAFTEKPTVKCVGKDRYEITFAVASKGGSPDGGYCDVTVAIVDPDPAKERVKGRGLVVRHLASGVLGPNAPAPFQKNSLKQTLYWDGKDDLGHYHKEPERLVVRVSLGLKPVFDKRLGGTSPHNTPGRIVGVAAHSSGVYVASACGRQRLHIRHFDHEGRYVKVLTCPPARMPPERLLAMAYVEYEPGKRALHGSDLYETVADHMVYLNFLGTVGDCQPAIAGGKIFFVNDGKFETSKIFAVGLDGETDDHVQGYAFMPGTEHNAPRLAASPDGRWIYATEVGADNQQGSLHRVLRIPADGSSKATVFFGKSGKPGGDDQHLNYPRGLDTDAAGRLYVCDYNNNRLLVLSPEGALLRKIPIERPFYVAVHKKTGAVYVQHATRVQGGKTVRRLAKLASVDNPQFVAHVDEGPRGLMALDSWTPKPRIWSTGAETVVASAHIQAHGSHTIVIWEEREGTFVPIVNFDSLAREADGSYYAGRWSGNALGDKVTCDPVREKAYVYNGGWIFDLPSGLFDGSLRHQAHPGPDDIAFDKRGYLHGHLRPTVQGVGVFRLHPDKRWATGASQRQVAYAEIPYDYGEEVRGYKGALRTRCQGGPKGFSDGLGVNMRGDVVVQSNIYYVPRMEDIERSGWVFQETRQDWHPLYQRGQNAVYATFQRWVQDMEKVGQQVYFIRRRPGTALAGATAWVFEATGRLQRECAVIAGDLINGVQIDEDGALYFVTARPRIFPDGRPYFLAGRGGTFGKPKGTSNRNPFTGTLVKTKPNTDCRILLTKAPIPMEPLPARAPDLMHTDWPNATGRDGWAWVEGAEWLYAGASPIVSVGCSCPSSRFHLDWYKRVYVPEQYRHAIGVVDTAGNLIMHIGQYGNYDDVRNMRPGDTTIAMSAVRFISGTDNYLVFDDHGEGITVLRLDYHAENTAPINSRP